MRKWLILFGLVALLVALIVLNDAITNWRYVVTGEPGAVLYVGTFDGFDDEWEQYQGRVEADIVEGVIRLTAEDVEQVPYSAAMPNFADFDLRVETRAVDGPVNNGYGVVFRLFDNQNQYIFLISSDGFYQVVRRVDGDDHRVSDWIRTPIIHQGIGVTNTVRVVGVGNRFWFYINDQLVQLCVPNDPDGESTYFNFSQECVEGTMQDVLVDDSLPVGRVGVVVRTLNEPGVVVEFDNFVVYGAAPPETESGDTGDG